MNKLKFIKEHFREIFFSFVMTITVITIVVVFAKIPTMKIFIDGSYLLAFCFVSAFFFCQGYSLPNEKTWQTFGDVLTIWLIIMLVTQIILATLSYLLFNTVTGEQFFAIFICLIIAYALIFFFFVIQLCDYKKSKEQKAK